MNSVSLRVFVLLVLIVGVCLSDDSIDTKRNLINVDKHSIEDDTVDKRETFLADATGVLGTGFIKKRDENALHTPMILNKLKKKSININNNNVNMGGSGMDYSDF